MSFFLDSFQGIVPFMERGIVKDDDRIPRRIGQQFFAEPRIKDIGVYVSVEQAYIEQVEIGDGPNGICPAPGMPVLFAMAPLSFFTVAVVPRGIKGKPALVHIDNGPFLHKLVAEDLELEDEPGQPIRLRMEKRFFYS